MVDLNQALKEVLNDLVSSSPAIKQAMILTVKEVLSVAAEDEEGDPDELSFFVRILFTVAHDMLLRTGDRSIENVYVRNKSGYFIMMYAGSKAILTVRASQNVKLGIVYLDLRRACEKIPALLPKEYSDLSLDHGEGDFQEVMTLLLKQFDEWLQHKKNELSSY